MLLHSVPSHTSQCAEKTPANKKNYQIPVFNFRKDRYNPAERVIYFTDTTSDGNRLQASKGTNVSRHEDAEFVECLDCGEVFDSEEFRDMEIEDTVDIEEDVPDDI